VGDEPPCRVRAGWAPRAREEAASSIALPSGRRLLNGAREDRGGCDPRDGVHGEDCRGCGAREDTRNTLARLVRHRPRSPSLRSMCLQSSRRVTSQDACEVGDKRPRDGVAAREVAVRDSSPRLSNSATHALPTVGRAWDAFSSPRRCSAPSMAGRRRVLRPEAHSIERTAVLLQPRAVVAIDPTLEAL